MAADENGQSKGHADDHRHQNPHPEGLEHGGPLDNVPHGGGRGADGRGQQGGQPHSGQDGHQGGDQNVDFRLLGHRLAQLGGNHGDEEHRQRPARPLAAGQGDAAQGVGGIAHRGQGKQHQGRRLEGVADGHGHGRAAHGGGVAPHRHQEGDAELLTQRVQNGADEQGAEQPLGHGPQCVHPIPLCREDNIFSLEKCAAYSHISVSPLHMS